MLTDKPSGREAERIRMGAWGPRRGEMSMRIQEIRTIYGTRSMTRRRLREAVRIDVSGSVKVVVRGGGSWDEARDGSEGSCRNMTTMHG